MCFADDDLLDNETIDVSSEILKTVSDTSPSLDSASLNSRACIVLDRKSNTIIYGKNEKNKVKMASTTKIMTATIVIENYDLSKTGGHGVWNDELQDWENRFTGEENKKFHETVAFKARGYEYMVEALIK